MHGPFQNFVGRFLPPRNSRNQRWGTLFQKNRLTFLSRDPDQHSTSTCRPCLNTNFCEGVVCIQIWQGCWWWGGFLLIPLMMIDTDTPSLLVPSSSLSKAWLHLMIIIITTSSTFNTPPQHNLKFHTQPVLIMITISKTAPPSRSPPQGVRDGAYMAGTVLRRHATLVVCSLNDDYSCLR